MYLDILLDYLDTYLSKVTHHNRISNITERITTRCNRLLPVYDNCKYLVHVYTNVNDVYLSVRIYATTIDTNGVYIQPDVLPSLDFKYGCKLTTINRTVFKDWFNTKRDYSINKYKHNIGITKSDLDNLLLLSSVGYTTVVLRDSISNNVYNDIKLEYDSILIGYIISMYKKIINFDNIETELIRWNGDVATVDIINNILTSYSNPIILLYNQSSILEYRR